MLGLSLLVRFHTTRDRTPFKAKWQNRNCKKPSAKRSAATGLQLLAPVGQYKQLLPPALAPCASSPLRAWLRRLALERERERAPWIRRDTLLALRSCLEARKTCAWLSGKKWAACFIHGAQTKGVAIFLPIGDVFCQQPRHLHGPLRRPHCNRSLQQYVLQSAHFLIEKGRNFADKARLRGPLADSYNGGSTVAWHEDQVLADAISGKARTRVERASSPIKTADAAALKRAVLGTRKEFARPATAQQPRLETDALHLDATATNVFGHSVRKPKVTSFVNVPTTYKWKPPTQAFFLMMAWFICISRAWKATSLASGDNPF